MGKCSPALTGMGEKNVDDTREAMSNGQMKSGTTSEVRGRVKLHTWIKELPGFAPEGGGGGGRAEIGEGGRV